MKKRIQFAWLPATLLLCGTAITVELLAAPPTTRKAPQEEEHAAKEGPPIRKLEPKEINRLRYLELRALRKTGNPDQPDPVKVKIPKSTVDEFLKVVQDESDFKKDPDVAKRNFLKLTAPQKLHYIAAHRGSDFVEKVEIQSDPEIFKDFKRSVMPSIVKTCATAGCHNATNEKAAAFRLWNDPKKSDSTTYANFLMLTELEVKAASTKGEATTVPLIDRAFPDKSPLLAYLLPEKDVVESERHPGDVKYVAPCRTRAADNYKRIEKWIGSLRHPAEDYRVYILRQKPPEPEPAAASEESADRSTTRPTRK